MNYLAYYFPLVLGCTLGSFAGQALYDWYMRWLRRRRSAELERRVAAELLSRGYTFDHVSLDAVGGDTPGPVTDEMVTRIADHCAAFMQFTHRPPDQS